MCRPLVRGVGATTSLCEVPHLGRDPQGLDDLTLLGTGANRTASEAPGDGGGRFEDDGLAFEPADRTGGRADNPWWIEGPGVPDGPEGAWSGACRCPEPSRRNSSWYGAATNCS